MPLKLDFKAGEKLIINGAVVENVGGNAKLLIHNSAAIIREKEILTQEEANTPGSRVYFALQCAYIFANQEEEYLASFRTYLDDYLAAAPSAKPIGDEILGSLDNGKMYKALKAAQRLIKHEAKTLQDLSKRLSALAETAE